MDLKMFADAIAEQMGIASLSPDANGIYQWRYLTHTYRMYAKNRQCYWECTIGDPLVQSRENSERLMQLLQFNLKRMRFLEGTIFMDPKTHQVYMQYNFHENGDMRKPIGEQWNDFCLNVEVIEDQVFPSTVTK
jgi:hypothetical protein